MVARVAQFEGVDVEEAQRTMEEAAAVIRPLVDGLAGYQGQLDLVTQDGKVLSVTFFDSDENAQAAEQTFDEEMPRRLGEIFKGWEGRRVSVDRYMVVADERR
jgi:heme-degrading monooxygenase HmoA